ncbi:MAG: hypothetical protein M3R52_07350, partial [Acidobacteriota bacterium]|nr:hypothetical protein [Acidobacteriota bacterium]
IGNLHISGPRSRRYGRTNGFDGFRRRLRRTNVSTTQQLSARRFPPVAFAYCFVGCIGRDDGPINARGTGRIV